MSSFPKPHQLDIPLEEMEIFELMQVVIQRGEARRVAGLYGTSEQTVRCWRNDPGGDDQAIGDPHGRRSPVANFLQFLDVLNAIDPARRDLVWARVEYEYASMRSIQGDNAMMSRRQAIKRVNALARELVQATDDLNGVDDGSIPTKERFQRSG
jgi:hypothetical protein